MYEAFEGASSKAEELRLDFVSSFWTYTIHSWPTELTYKWWSLLRWRSVHGKAGRNVPRVVGLTQLFFHGSFIVTNNGDIQNRCEGCISNHGIAHGIERKSSTYIGTLTKIDMPSESQFAPTEICLNFSNSLTLELIMVEDIRVMKRFACRYQRDL